MNFVHGMEFVEVVKKDSLFSLSHISHLLSSRSSSYECMFAVCGGMPCTGRERGKEREERRNKDAAGKGKGKGKVE